MIVRAFTLALLLCASTVASAQDAVARVDAYLATLKTLSADFEQVVRDDKGQITQRAEGHLTLSRPNRFRWDYRKPYLQTIVADGRKLWLYDSDLQQVTVRPLEQGLGSTPAMLLSGTGKAADAFVAGEVVQRGDITWCTLKPKQSGSDFERVALAFDAKGGLVAMELADKLGQVTSLAFLNISRNGRVDAGAFKFTPPKGADVIGSVAP